MMNSIHQMMLRTARSLMMASALVAFSTAAANACGSNNFDFCNCQVDEVVVADTRNAHFHVNCPVANRPACAADGFIGFDRSTPDGKQYLAVVLMAQATNASVTGYVEHAAGSCPSWQSNVSLLTHLRLVQ